MSPELQNLSVSQRALVAGGFSLREPGLDRGKIAKSYDVHIGHISHGRCVQRDAEPHIVAMVSDGRLFCLAGGCCNRKYSARDAAHMGNPRADQARGAET